MKSVTIKQVDAFTTVPFCGNPAGVVSAAAGLSAPEMQKIANEMNLSETTFVLPPTDPKADFWVRYFTPRSELAVAGHPTIATTHVLIEEGKIALDKKQRQIWLETGVGVLPVDIEVYGDGRYTISMSLAVPKFGTVAAGPEELAAMLGTDSGAIDGRYPAQKVSTGIYWLIVPLTTLQAVRNLRPDLGAITALSQREKIVGITVFTTETENPDCDVHVRTFAPIEGVVEDPVCGTGNSCVGAYIAENSVLPWNRELRIASEQGLEIGRPGRVSVKVEGKPGAITRVQISGEAVTVLTGQINF